MSSKPLISHVPWRRGAKDLGPRFFSFYVPFKQVEHVFFKSNFCLCALKRQAKMVFACFLNLFWIGNKYLE